MGCRVLVVVSQPSPLLWPSSSYLSGVLQGFQAVIALALHLDLVVESDVVDRGLDCSASSTLTRKCDL